MTSFLFLDIETTGMSPEKNNILEIAWCLTDERFDKLYVPHSYTIQTDDTLDRWWEFSDNEIVREMHLGSGLWDDILEGKDAKSLGEIYTALYAELLTTKEGEPIHLAGSSVHFDKAFLGANGWGSLWEGGDALIHHRILDLSALRLMFTSAGVPIEEAENVGAHRAVNDVTHDVEQARIFRRTLGALAVEEAL